MNKSKILKTSISVLVILFVWYLVTEMGIVNSYVLPSPLKVIDSFCKMVKSGEIFEDIYINGLKIYENKDKMIGTIVGRAEVGLTVRNVIVLNVTHNTLGAMGGIFGKDDRKGQNLETSFENIFTDLSPLKDEEGNVIEGKPATNNYIGDGATPRALWYPWLKTGSYQTDGWVTVSIPLSDFKYNHEGKELEEGLSKGDFGGLTFFVYHGGVAGEACSPQISIDNIRVVPAE